MSIRETVAYKELDSYLAVGRAEGFEEGTEEQQKAAWQYIYDKGLWKGLQGFFGRTIEGLLSAGLLEKKGE